MTKPVRLAVLGVAVLALAALFGFGLLRGAPDRDIESTFLGEAAPGFNMSLYERYQAEYGQQLDTADLAGTPMVVNFWASWCIPCYQEAPVLQSYWQQYQDSGVMFVGVHTQNQGGYADGTAFIDQFGLTFPNGFDGNSRISVDWGLYGVPETFFVDRNGQVRYKHVGPVSAEVMEQQLAVLLN